MFSVKIDFDFISEPKYWKIATLVLVSIGMSSSVISLPQTGIGLSTNETQDIDALYIDNHNPDRLNAIDNEGNREVKQNTSVNLVSGTGDFDGDGDIDVVFESDKYFDSSGMILRYTDAEGNYVNLTSTPNSIALGSMTDFDGDGTQEVLYGEHKDADTNHLKSIDYQGNITDIGIDTWGESGVIGGAADVDGNSDIEVATVNTSQEIIFVKSNGTSINTGVFASDEYRVGGIADYDNDGILEVAAIDWADTSILEFIEPNGEVQSISPGPNMGHAGGAADWDQDGKIEVIVRTGENDSLKAIDVDGEVNDISSSKVWEPPGGIADWDEDSNPPPEIDGTSQEPGVKFGNSNIDTFLNASDPDGSNSSGIVESATITEIKEDGTTIVSNVSMSNSSTVSDWEAKDVFSVDENFVWYNISYKVTDDDGATNTYTESLYINDTTTLEQSYSDNSFLYWGDQLDYGLGYDKFDNRLELLSPQNSSLMTFNEQGEMNIQTSSGENKAVLSSFGKGLNLLVESVTGSNILLFNSTAGEVPRSTLDTEKKQVVVDTATTTSFTTTDQESIFVNTGSATATVTLASEDRNSGNVIQVKDSGENACQNSITIDTEGSATIEGQDSIKLNNDDESVELQWDGSEWSVMSHYKPNLLC